MSCIAYVCKCVLLKKNVTMTQIKTGSITLVYMILKIVLITFEMKCLKFLTNFFGVVDGLMIGYDGEHYICCCSKCIIEIKTRYSIQKDFIVGKHDGCLDEIDAYFNKRIKKEVRESPFFKPGTSAQTIYSVLLRNKGRSYDLISLEGL